MILRQLAEEVGGGFKLHFVASRIVKVNDELAVDQVKPDHLAQTPTSVVVKVVANAIGAKLFKGFDKSTRVALKLGFGVGHDGFVAVDAVKALSVRLLGRFNQRRRAREDTGGVIHDVAGVFVLIVVHQRINKEFKQRAGQLGLAVLRQTRGKLDEGIEVISNVAEGLHPDVLYFTELTIVDQLLHLTNQCLCTHTALGGLVSEFCVSEISVSLFRKAK